MAIISGFSSALSGMKVAQSQIGLVSNNLANVDTEGYTRKTAQQLSNVVAGTGLGVKLANADRLVDQSLLRSYLMANSLNGNINKTYDYLSKTENLLGTPENNNSIATDVANLQSNLETLATDVTSSVGRYALISSASSLTSRLNTISTEIQSLRGDADLEIQTICDEINNQLSSIANLNNQIVKYKALGYDGQADLEDQRDESLKKLSGYIDITYYSRDNGEVVIQTKGGASLLDKEAHTLTHNAIARAATDISYANGNIDGIYVDGEDITPIIKDGELKGLIDIRDTVLPSLQSQLDEIAGVMVDTLNAVHNQGTSFPGAMTTIQGSRSFISPDTQKIKIEKGDVRLAIFDDNGEQIATASMLADLNFSSSGETITDTLSKIETWMQKTLPEAHVRFDANGRVVIDTGDSNYYFSIMDTENSTLGSGQADATISLDNNQDGVVDRTFYGFSAFMGLNDLFVTSSGEYIYQSNVMSKNVDLGIRSSISLNIRTASLNESFTLGAGDTLQSIVAKINSNEALNDKIYASLVPNGSGYMLQIINSSGEQMEISENAVGGQITGFLSRIGLKVSHCNSASLVAVREDILVNPNILSVGSPEFDTHTGQYRLSSGNNNVANNMSKVFAEEHTFGQAGSLAKVTTTLADYASTFVGGISSQTSSAENNLSYQSGLVTSIADKQASISGVDSDEELANLIIYQQSYAACAQVWSATRELLDILFQAI